LTFSGLRHIGSYANFAAASVAEPPESFNRKNWRKCQMSERQKTVVLTGASRGIGHATAIRFYNEGWRIITCARQAFPKGHPGAAPPENHIQIDLADRKGLVAGIEKIRECLGGSPLNALVNNAAVSPKAKSGKRLGSIEIDLAMWQTVFQVNFFSPIMLARGLIKELEVGQASIVNITSIAGSRVHPFAGSAYATSKAALAALTREMAADFGPYGIRVNAIAPGEIDTSILSPGTEELVKLIPLRRLGKPEEVADMIYFLCSDQSNYVSGAEIHVNGGQHV
jgi:NAD(P)-dependent dehydrogenase (short-subunit alcohol dehydrogenase family)